ncbi:zona pellucida sperm-binding protein 4-like isoform X2 [Notothenia coriiceps]|uniref:Zona pellucida sperm-binding protein 4-like isoform X2 n=1 Tax=Notothenia coriiceps TaxID=8208 RepID=A0A6I9NH73_9TELE|nr:PREDICTED: zona pellucida sperm-binding protein 4-like isoform X2 [Notothenia coriiceps]
MLPHSTNFILVSLSLLILKCKTHAATKPPQAAVSNTNSNHTSICHDGFMSVYLSKMQFPDLRFNIYVQDEHSGYYQAISIAKQCHYFLGEADTFIVLTVAPYGCFVRRQKHVTSLTVVITALDRGIVDIVKSIPLICERKVKEVRRNDKPLASKNKFCNKDGFNITIYQSATVPPLNLDACWIPSGQSDNCKPKIKSKEAVTFSFPFTDCGTQSKISEGIMTYWVNIEVKQHLHEGPIFRDIPFLFTLAQISKLDVEVKGGKSVYPSTLRNEGILRTEMRFAKDSNYKYFHSSRDLPIVTELGKPVYVDVFVLKQEDKDLVLLLEDCWATPTKNPYDPQRWNLLVKGCPFSGDSHQTGVLPVVPKVLKYPSLHKWFVVKMFSFVKPPAFENLVYFHCDIEISKGPDYLQSCSNKSRILRQITPRPEQSNLYSVVSGGPLIYL